MTRASDDGPTTVLVIGLDPHRVPGPWDPKPVADAIANGLRGLRDHGFTAEACLLGLDGSDDIHARVVAALAARRWDCVIVGAGIRDPQCGPDLFEKIINLIRRHAPAAAIAFNHSPHDLADAAARSLRH